jgi:hypothetical protein
MHSQPRTRVTGIFSVSGLGIFFQRVVDYSVPYNVKKMTKISNNDCSSLLLPLDAYLFAKHCQSLKKLKRPPPKTTTTLLVSLLQQSANATIAEISRFYLCKICLCFTANVVSLNLSAAVSPSDEDGQQ